MPRQTKIHHSHTVAAHKTKKQKEPFDYLVYFFTIATPLFEIPQAVTIYANHAAHDVSIWTWGFFILDNIVWIAYGLRKKLRPVYISSFLYLIIEASIVFGIVHYATK
jgi:uncharacterized protein with PQ loop repeat